MPKSHDQGLTARSTVRRLDLSRGTLWKIEAQLRCVTDQELIALAESLGVPLGERVKESNPRPSHRSGGLRWLGRLRFIWSSSRRH